MTITYDSLETLIQKNPKILINGRYDVVKFILIRVHFFLYYTTKKSFKLSSVKNKIWNIIVNTFQRFTCDSANSHFNSSVFKTTNKLCCLKKLDSLLLEKIQNENCNLFENILTDLNNSSISYSQLNEINPNDILENNNLNISCNSSSIINLNPLFNSPTNSNLNSNSQTNSPNSFINQHANLLEFELIDLENNIDELIESITDAENGIGEITIKLSELKINIRTLKNRYTNQKVKYENKKSFLSILKEKKDNLQLKYNAKYKEYQDTQRSISNITNNINIINNISNNDNNTTNIPNNNNNNNNNFDDLSVDDISDMSDLSS